MNFLLATLYLINRGISSDGRAPLLQGGGRRFESVILHQLNINFIINLDDNSVLLEVI